MKEFEIMLKYFECPECKMKSYNPNDIRKQYCGNCKKYYLIMIKKEQDDPVALRVSIGGNCYAGYYIVYRGDIKKIKKMMSYLNQKLQEYEETENESN